MSATRHHQPTRRERQLGVKHKQLHSLGKSRGWRCRYCDRRTHCAACFPNRPPNRAATRDHYVPKSRGGGSGWRNLELSCRACNEKKADLLPQEAGGWEWAVVS